MQRPPFRGYPQVCEHRQVVGGFAGLRHRIDECGNVPDVHEMRGIGHPTKYFGPGAGFFRSGSLPDVVCGALTLFFHRGNKLRRHCGFEGGVSFRTVIAVGADDTRFILHLNGDDGLFDAVLGF